MISAMAFNAQKDKASFISRVKNHLRRKSKSPGTSTALSSLSQTYPPVSVEGDSALYKQGDVPNEDSDKNSQTNIDVEDWHAHTIVDYHQVEFSGIYEGDDASTFSDSDDETAYPKASPERNNNELRSTCKRCSKIPIRQMLLSMIGDETHDRRWNFDLLSAFSKKAYCSLCQLVIDALYQDPNWETLELLEKGTSPLKRPQCVLRSVNQCVQISTSIGLTGEIRVLEEDLYLFESRLKLRKRRFPDLEQDWLGRQTPPAGQLDIGHIRNWLDICEKDHQECSAASLVNDRDQKPIAPIKLILIDIHREQLVEATSEFRYVALSYVWGQAKTSLNTVKSNYIELQQEGSVSAQNKKIPQVIQTAMELVGNLGERYLWVDALCIAQDDEDKLSMIKQMDLVYSQAKMTVFAIGGAHADIPLAGVRPESRRLPQSIATLQGVRCLATSPSLKSVLNCSIHGLRGWTYQEQLLSTRCLFISDRHAYFRCMSGTWSEDRVGALNDQNLNPLQELRQKPLKTYFPYYEMLVKNYTERDLTYDADITKAFAGITSDISRISSVDFAAGLPLQCFCHAMLFMPIGEGKRRRPSPIEQGGEYFPSWSWTGWVGPVTYELAWLWNQNDIFTIKSAVTHMELLDAQGTHPLEPFTARTSAAHAKICSFNFLDRMTTKVSGDAFPKLEITPSPGSVEKIVLSFHAPAVRATQFRFGPSMHECRTTESDTKYFCVPVFNKNDHQCGGIFGPQFPADLQERLPNCQLVMFGYFHRWGAGGEYATVAEGVFGDHFLKSSTWCGCICYVLLVENLSEGQSERLAIGQIHPEAWAELQGQRELIRLV